MKEKQEPMKDTSLTHSQTLHPNLSQVDGSDETATDAGLTDKERNLSDYFRQLYRSSSDIGPKIDSSKVNRSLSDIVIMIPKDKSVEGAVENDTNENGFEVSDTTTMGRLKDTKMDNNDMMELNAMPTRERRSSFQNSLFVSGGDPNDKKRRVSLPCDASKESWREEYEYNFEVTEASTGKSKPDTDAMVGQNIEPTKERRSNVMPTLYQNSIFVSGCDSSDKRRVSLPESPSKEIWRRDEYRDDKPTVHPISSMSSASRRLLDTDSNFSVKKISFANYSEGEENKHINSRSSEKSFTSKFSDVGHLECPVTTSKVSSIIEHVDSLDLLEGSSFHNVSTI